jgi:hypothetical protein
MRLNLCPPLYWRIRREVALHYSKSKYIVIVDGGGNIIFGRFWKETENATVTVSFVGTGSVYSDRSVMIHSMDKSAADVEACAFFHSIYRSSI